MLFDWGIMQEEFAQDFGLADIVSKNVTYKHVGYWDDESGGQMGPLFGNADTSALKQALLELNVTAEEANWICSAGSQTGWSLWAAPKIEAELGVCEADARDDLSSDSMFDFELQGWFLYI